MTCVTLADLRCEFRRFAEDDIRKELFIFSQTVLPQCLVTTLQKVIGDRGQAFEGSLSNVHDLPLPGQTVEARLQALFPAAANMDTLSTTGNNPETLPQHSHLIGSCGPTPAPPTEFVGEETPERRTHLSITPKSEAMARAAACPGWNPSHREDEVRATNVTSSLMAPWSVKTNSPGLGTPSWHSVVPTPKVHGHKLDIVGISRSIRRSNHVEELKNNDLNSARAILRETTATTRSSSGHTLDRNQSFVRRVIEDSIFEYLMLFFIVLNTILIGVDTELRAEDPSAENHPVLVQLDAIMLFVFSIDIAARFYVFRCWIFRATTPSGERNRDRLWTIFDCAIVGIGIASWIVQFIWSSKHGVIGNLSVALLLRVVRLGRLLRMGKVLQAISSLRKIIHSVLGTVSLFFWMTFLLWANVYTFGLYFTELVASKSQEGVSEDLRTKFGSLGRTQCTLLASISGGVDWLDVFLPLTDEFGHVLVDVPFFFYLSFSLCCLLNVCLGLFMDAASGFGQQATEAYLLQQALEIFQAADDDDDGKIRWNEFEAVLAKPGMSEFFNTIDLELSQAHILFQLLDFSGDGLVSCAEFLHGCLRVRGTAKALDLLVMSREVLQAFDRLLRECAADTQLNRQILLDLAAGQIRLLDQSKKE